MTEILRTGSATPEGIGHREVAFRGGPGGAVRPRLADDVFLVAARGPDPGPHRSGLDALAELARSVDPAALARERRALGGPAGLGGVEVSASFLGRRTYNRYDIEDAVGGALAERAGVAFHSRREGGAPPSGYSGWRLTLDGSRASLLLRLGERPAHRRGWKSASVPGTLHPPVAAAMAQAAGLLPGQRVLDPCCGAGTLLVEAHHTVPGLALTGLDLDPAALRAARSNTAGLPVRIGRGDAGELPFADGSVDRVLCNPPWGEQVAPLGVLARRPERWWHELARVLAGDGCAVLLLPDARGLVSALDHGLAPAEVQRLSLFGNHPFLVRLERVRPRRGRGRGTGG